MRHEVRVLITLFLVVPWGTHIGQGRRVARDLTYQAYKQIAVDVLVCILER